jgi:uncharacterized membrane protein
MFATFFLLILIRFYRKTTIGIILLTACISLHRLTGFVAIMYIIFDSIFNQRCKSKMILCAVFFGLITYIPTIQIQILPFINQSMNGDFILLEGKYGTGFNKPIFWTYTLPLCVLVFFTIVSSLKKNILKNKKPIIASLLVLFFIILVR